MSMRILMVGHTYLVEENQKKLWALAKQPGVQLELVTPHRWPEPLLGSLSPHVALHAPFATRPIRAVCTGAEQFYWYLSADLGMRRFKPDVLCVEQGAGSFVYAQSLLYRGLHARRAKAVFFTWWNLPYQARWPLSAIERFNLRRSQGAVAGNSDAAALLREHGFGGPLAVLPQLGIDPEEFRPADATDLRRRLGLDRFTVGFAGRFVETKGILVLLEALRGAAFDFQLLLLGRGPLEPEIRARVASGGWSNRVKIVSGLGHREIARYYRCMDVMVLPSLTRPPSKEQFGHVLIEAMASEVPVIGSDCGEIPNVIGDAGFLTPEGDAKALLGALARVAASPALRREMGTAGRRRVLDLYTHDGLARRLVAFFRSL
jgi:glycosyltransferase involved in cell wall biosynthesis